jgi:hypothetical protein
VVGDVFERLYPGARAVVGLDADRLKA